jgi:hypothetical protein
VNPAALKGLGLKPCHKNDANESGFATEGWFYG